jgi:serine/threonine protein kinase
LFEYERDRPQEIQEVNDVRFCCSKEFLIGRGSDGTKVFVGLSKDGYEKAVKRLENDDDGASLAEQEKKILTSIDSKHVVKYRFLEKSNKEWLFLIMDLCEETLEDYVKNSVVDGWSKKVRDIIEQVLKGIADLHRDPIILHRDLKPRNILRDVDHNWLLVDFGISRNLPPGVNTLLSKERGTDYWKAVESCSNDTFNNGAVRYLTKSDIQVGLCLMTNMSKFVLLSNTPYYSLGKLFNNVCVIDEFRRFIHAKGCLYERRDGTFAGTGRFIHPGLRAVYMIPLCRDEM